MSILQREGMENREGEREEKEREREEKERDREEEREGGREPCFMFSGWFLPVPMIARGL